MEPFAIATGTMDYAQNVYIRLYTDAGIYGVGECSAFPFIVGETQDTCIAVAKDFAKLWKGKDASGINARLQELNNIIAGNTTIKSAFDMALYDLNAKMANMPLYKYLGGEKKQIETDITIGIGTVEEMVYKAQQFQKNGAKCLKIKLGKDAKQDITRVEKIRDAVGTEMFLRLDANQGWEFEDAVFALNSMEPYNIQFCEQPMRSWNDDLLPELRKRTSIKIMADESCYSHHDARRLIATQACDYINIKLVKSGGLAEAIRIHDIAAQANMPCMIGGMLETRLALSAKLHFAYAFPNIKYYDLDTCLIGHLEDPVIGGARYEGYLLNIDDLPGIGADIDESYLKDCEMISI